MNKIRTGKFVEFSSGTLVLLTIVLVVTVSRASAKEHKPKGSGSRSQVVAHISFSGLSAVDMAMQKKPNDKYYLYVEHYQQTHSPKRGWSNPVARSRPVGQDEPDGCFGDHCRKRVFPDA